MPKLALGQEWEAADIDTDLRASEYNVWAIKIIYVTKYKGRTVGLGLKINRQTRAEFIEDDGYGPECWWFRESGKSFDDPSLTLKLVRPL